MLYSSPRPPHPPMWPENLVEELGDSLEGFQKIVENRKPRTKVVQILGLVPAGVGFDDFLLSMYFYVKRVVRRVNPLVLLPRPPWMGNTYDLYKPQVQHQPPGPYYEHFI
jgi:hypothetical protein